MFTIRLSVLKIYFFQRDDNTSGRERAAELQERLEQIAQNDPNVDSPSLVTLKVKEIGEWTYLLIFSDKSNREWKQVRMPFSGRRTLNV